jgi:hypothetical protein
MAVLMLTWHIHTILDHNKTCSACCSLQIALKAQATTNGYMSALTAIFSKVAGALQSQTKNLGG